MQAGHDDFPLTICMVAPGAFTQDSQISKTIRDVLVKDEHVRAAHIEEGWMRLEGKVAIVTGSSSGVGKGIAIGFAREGATVVVTCSHNQAGAHEVAAEIERLGCQSLVVQGDVGRKKDAHALINQTQAAFGRLDILVNCAGISLRAPFAEFPEEYWDIIHRTNLKGTFLCSQAAVPLLRQSRGAILNIASINGAITTYNFAAYAASKAGIEGLTRGMAIDLGQYGIRVNALRVGWIAVERDVDLGEEIRQKNAERFPLHRIGEVEDVMGPAVFMCSDDARFVTGAVLPVDGGHSIIFNSGYPQGVVPEGAWDRPEERIR